MSAMLPISPATLLARLGKRLRVEDPSDPEAWAKVFIADQEALVALDDVLCARENAEFLLGFWLGFSEGAAVFRKGAWSQAHAVHLAQLRGSAGGRETARKADDEWRTLAGDLLVEIVRKNPTFGRERLTRALFEHPKFEPRSGSPSDPSVYRLIASMRKAGRLPRERVTGSGGGS